MRKFILAAAIVIASASISTPAMAVAPSDRFQKTTPGAIDTCFRPGGRPAPIGCHQPSKNR